MKSEIKKYLSRKYVRMVIIILVVFSVLLGFFSGIRQSSYEDENGKIISGGKEAAIYERDKYSSVGSLTIEKLNVVLRYYKKVYDTEGEENAYIKTDAKYPGVMALLSEVYFSDSEFNSKGLYKLDNVNDFYYARINAINKKVESVRIQYHNSEVSNIKEEAKNLSTPINYGWGYLWKVYFRVFSVISILCAIATILIGSDVFSYEKSRQMDLILCALSKKSILIHRIKKIIGLEILVSAIYITCVLLLTIFFWQFMKMPVLNSQLQLIYPMSITNISIRTAIIGIFILTWIGILTVGFVSMCMNEVLNNGLRSIGISLGVLFIPILISSFSFIPAHIYDIFSIQPANAFMVEKIFKSLHIYSLLGKKVLTAYKIGAIDITYWIVISMIFILRVQLKTYNRGY